MRYAKKMVLIPEDLYLSLQNAYQLKPQLSNDSIEKLARNTAEAQEIYYANKNRKRLDKKLKNENKPLLVEFKKEEPPQIQTALENKFPKLEKLKTPKLEKFSFKSSTPNNQLANISKNFVKSESESDSSNDEENEFFDTSNSFTGDDLYSIIKKQNPPFLSPNDEIYKTDLETVYKNSALTKCLEHLKTPVGNAPPGTSIVLEYINENNLQEKLYGSGLKKISTESKKIPFRFKPTLWRKPKNDSTSFIPRLIQKSVLARQKDSTRKRKRNYH